MQYELVTSTVQSGESKVKQTLKINYGLREEPLDLRAARRGDLTGWQ